MTVDRVRRRAGPRVYRALLGALIAACLASCADLGGPPYQRPDAPTKSSWSGPEARVSASETITPDWWQEFRDPTLDALVSKAKKAGARARGLLLEGVAWEQLVHTARARKANLIVMGTHGRTGLARLFLGSVAERVVGSAPCPVLTVRAKK